MYISLYLILLFQHRTQQNHQLVLKRKMQPSNKHKLEIEFRQDDFQAPLSHPLSVCIKKLVITHEITNVLRDKSIICECWMWNYFNILIRYHTKTRNH